MSQPEQPMQPIVKTERGQLRFHPNAVVLYLLDEASAGRKCDMNTLACQDFSDEDRRQFAQLIGYSLHGYGELRSYVDDVAYAKAAHLAENPETHPAEVEIGILKEKLRSVRIGMRDAIAELYEIHPDDLIEIPEEDEDEDEDEDE